MQKKLATKLFGSTFLFLASMSNAMEVPEIFSKTSENRFQKIKALYDNGTAVDFAILKGSWSGRCFRYSDPFTPANFLLAAGFVEINDDAGPEFPVQQVKRIASLRSSYGGADYFDNMGEEEKAGVLNQIPGFLKQLPDATEFEGTYSSKLFGDTLILRVRRNGNYFVAISELVKDLEDQKIGDTYSACYAFKKLD